MQATVKLMAEQATEQISVEWEGIGQFVATKHPEYVQEDPDSGLQTMYPPRITYRLQSEVNLWGCFFATGESDKRDTEGWPKRDNNLTIVTRRQISD